MLLPGIAVRPDAENPDSCEQGKNFGSALYSQLEIDDKSKNVRVQ